MFNPNDPQFQKRTREVALLLQKTQIKLKRHYKWSNRKIEDFMQKVFDYLMTDKNLTVEEAIEWVLENDRSGSGSEQGS